MSTNFSIELEPREELGSSHSRRLRRQGRVPVVVYGANKKNAYYSADHNSMIHNLEVEAFHSAIIDVKENGKKQGTILREVQMHPYKTQILHVDLLRVRASEQITLRVPLHFEGDEMAPGIKVQGGIFTRLVTDVEIQCLPKDLPEYLTVDVSELEMNQAVHLSDVQLPEGVEMTAMLHEGDDFAIASISPSRISAEIEEEDEIDEEEVLVEPEVEEESDQ